MKSRLYLPLKEKEMILFDQSIVDDFKQMSDEKEFLNGKRLWVNPLSIHLMIRLQILGQTHSCYLFIRPIRPT